MREEETALLLKKISECSPEAVNLSELFMTLTNDIVSRAAFGRKYSGGESGEKCRKLMKEFVGILGGFDFGTFLPSFAWIDRVSDLEAKVERVAVEMDEFLEGVVEEHLDNHKRVSNLLGGRVENEGLFDSILDTASLYFIASLVLIGCKVAYWQEVYYTSVQGDMKLRSIKVIPEPGNKLMIVVNNKSAEKQFAAEKISSMVLTKMKEIVEAYLGSTVKNPWYELAFGAVDESILLFIITASATTVDAKNSNYI
uniref:Cytochrome P450 71A20-like n=2 Tax=Nicotiana TaxID=4085 RepID=A0A1S4A086_TOBAC|nr:PREDICTED: cytochrome P450 71A20-like [Nicotiana sylvestris]XP_016470107.1 PREDICTED: cytochrome P450 71A20-like [Nicotiana tabacum]